MEHLASWARSKLNKHVNKNTKPNASSIVMKKCSTSKTKVRHTFQEI